MAQSPLVVRLSKCSWLNSVSRRCSASAKCQRIPYPVQYLDALGDVVTAQIGTKVKGYPDALRNCNRRNESVLVASSENTNRFDLQRGHGSIVRQRGGEASVL